MYEPLRHLGMHSPNLCLRTPQRRFAIGRRRSHALRLDARNRSPEHLSNFVTELGVSVIGGCCGTTPEHLAHVVDRCADLVPAPRTITHEPGASSLYSFVPFAQETSFLSVGERTNANGSKRFREAMLAGDFDLTTAMAREQVKEGSHLIDVCVDYTGADGVADMNEVISRIATQASAPIVIDSTEAPGRGKPRSRWLGGRSVLNSVNLEDGDGEGNAPRSRSCRLPPSTAQQRRLHLHR